MLGRVSFLVTDGTLASTSNLLENNNVKIALCNAGQCSTARGARDDDRGQGRGAFGVDHLRYSFVHFLGIQTSKSSYLLLFAQTQGTVFSWVRRICGTIDVLFVLDVFGILKELSKLMNGINHVTRAVLPSIELSIGANGTVRLLLVGSTRYLRTLSVAKTNRSSKS